MITFQGAYFDGKSSKAYPVTFTFSGQLLHILLENETSLLIPVLDCTIMPPIGKAHRIIKLPSGAQIETTDEKAIADLEMNSRSNSGMRLVYYFENRWKAVATALLGLAFFVWAFITLGIPVLAKKIAYSIPPEMTEKVSKQTMRILDNGLMKPSELSNEKIEELQKVFTRLHNSAINYRLEFRKSPEIGPNAFALPSGIIIMTDELVKLAHDNRELEGILLHEMTHVEKRHSLRTVIQNAGAFLIISALIGDIASISSTAGALPMILTQSGYSRIFEQEADKYAVLYFIQKGWSTKPYQDILLRITKDAPNYPGNSFFSSHPLTKERVKYIQDFEKSAPNKTSIND